MTFYIANPAVNILKKQIIIKKEYSVLNLVTFPADK
jgi:hypothetical protein